MRTVVIALLGTVLSSSASAEPGFARMFRGQYGWEPACHACHTEGGGSELTTYGADFKKAGKTAAALSAIEPRDSDHDGVANLAEIQAKANPGSRGSTPDKPGDWLDPSRLIPAEVQKVYPAVRTYKPLDALFTADEIARAKALGVSLSEADETTIYVPFDGGQAQGAAVIVPTRIDGKPLFLVVATDRALNLKAVVPIAAKDAPQGVKIDPSFIGKRINQIEVREGLAPSDVAIAAGVKKAAAMLYVRLTKGVEK